MSSPTPAESGNERGARCVLWHAPGRRPPAELLRALAKRGFAVRAVQNAYGAMAELCLLERRASSAASRRYVLLLVEPETLEEASQVLAAMRRYAPGAVGWAYEAGANRPLHEIVQEREARAPAPVARGHGLRLAGEGPVRDSGLDPDADRADKDDAGGGLGHLLTDEELAMLLDEPETRAGGSADGD